MRKMDHKTALQQAVADTFENMAFQEMTPVPVNPMPAPVLRSFRQASMSVFVPVQGTLVITLSPAMLKAVTANVYGIDNEEVEPQMEADTLAEVLNTISGSWMRSITDVDQPYELGLPDTASADYIDSKTAELHCIFSADGDFLEVAFFAI